MMTPLFKKDFLNLLRRGTTSFFDLHGDKSWGLNTDALITFFRQHDQTSAITGKRQAVTFEALSSLCGHSEMPEVKGKSKTKSEVKTKVKKADKPVAVKPGVDSMPPANQTQGVGKPTDKNVGLTVRIEVNLPSDGDQETYDRIFKSIRENLLNG